MKKGKMAYDQGSAGRRRWNFHIAGLLRLPSATSTIFGDVRRRVKSGQEAYD